MKKIRNHFLILFGLLLLGIFFLAIGTSAKTFPWLNLNSRQSTSQYPISKDNKNTMKSANKLSIGDSRNIYIHPIGASLGISHSDNIENTDVSSDVGDDTDTSGNNGKSITNSIQPNSTGILKVTASSKNTGNHPNKSNKSSKAPANTNSGSSPSPSSGSTSSTSSSESTSSTPPDSAITPSGTDSSTSSGSGGSSHSGHHSSSRTVAITGVSLDKPTLYFPEAGDTATLKSTVSPANTTQGKSITWSSADESIAAVDRTGKVTAVKGGRTKVTAKTVNGKTAVCDVTVRIPATKVTLDLNNQPEIEIEKGSSLSLSASLEPADTTDGIKWTTSDSKIITVDSSGKITAVNAGTATIKATAGDVSAECKVTVGISITKIQLSDTDLTLKKGDTKAITATIVPPDTTEDKTLTWSSSDDKVATVDSSGNITAAGGGKAVITVQAGKHISQCNVTVAVSLTGIKFDPGTFKVTKGKTDMLSPVFTPSDATDKALTWGSSDPSIATVDGTSGKVTGVNVGTTTITAISHDGGFVTQCTVDVVIPVTGVSIDKSSIKMIKGKTDTLAATIMPEDATDKALNWGSSDTSVATVDGNGKVTATGGGSAEITVTTHDGGFTAKCNVTVTVPVTGIKLEKTNLSVIKGTDGTLNASILPEDATDKSISWSSDNTSVATVDSTGKVTGINVGTAVITATTHDGGFTAKCSVTVTPDHYKITVNAGTNGSVSGGGVYHVGSTCTITATANDNYHFVSWTDSSGNVISSNTTYTISGVYKDITLIAKFEENGILCTVKNFQVTYPNVSSDNGTLKIRPYLSSTNNTLFKVFVPKNVVFSFRTITIDADIYFSSPITIQGGQYNDSSIDDVFVHHAFSDINRHNFVNESYLYFYNKANVQLGIINAYRNSRNYQHPTSTLCGVTKIHIQTTICPPSTYEGCDETDYVSLQIIPEGYTKQYIYDGALIK